MPLHVFLCCDSNLSSPHLVAYIARRLNSTPWLTSSREFRLHGRSLEELFSMLKGRWAGGGVYVSACLQNQELTFKNKNPICLEIIETPHDI